MRNRIIFFIPLLAGVLATQAIWASEEDGRSESAAILQVRAEFNEAIADHDAARIAGFLDSDYQVTTGSGRHYRESPEEDALAWAEIFAERPDIVYVRTPGDVAVSTYRELAAENGTWVGRWTSQRGGVEMGGRYFAQWRKVDDAWKIRAEIFVTLYCTGPGCE